MNSKTVGERTEGIILAELLKAGYVVLLPFGDNQRYDLVIEEGGVFKRVQCKTASLAVTSAALTFKTCSSYAHRGGGYLGYRGAADLFGVYSPDTGRCYLVPVEDVGERQATLRLEPARNGQASKVRLAQQYELK
jgi:PD-(D/E)XK endonuclease